MNNPWITTDEAAERLRVTTRTVWNMVSRGQLRAFSSGRGSKALFMQSDIDRAIRVRNAINALNELKEELKDEHHIG